MQHNLESYMIKGPFIGEPDLQLKEALEMMRDLDFRHLPVTSDGKLVGIVSERDLREAVACPKSETLRVGDVMKQDVFTVLKDTPLKSVAREMADSKCGSAVVVNNRNEVVGIFTTTDALRILADLLDEEDDEDLYLTDDYYESWSPVSNF